jgi:hypothetical protein
MGAANLRTDRLHTLVGNPLLPLLSALQTFGDLLTEGDNAVYTLRFESGGVRKRSMSGYDVPSVSDEKTLVE